MKKGFKTIKPLGGARDPRHGTPGGYTYWGCRCVKCLEANRLLQREIRAEKLANLTEADHGRAYTYTCGCRCQRCKDAHSMSQRIKTERRRPKHKTTTVKLNSLA